MITREGGGLLASGVSRVVAVLLPNLANSIFAETAQGLSDTLQAAGYELLIAATEQGMREQGLSRLVTHVRATNVPSMAVFKNLGCRFSAVVFSKTSGALVGSLGMGRLGLRALPAAGG